MRTVAVVQARMGSTRLRDKVMAEIVGTPLIGLLLGRLSRAKLVDQVVLATSMDRRNDPLCEYVGGMGFRIHRGSENDVLDRYYRVAEETDAETVVRITGDCPLVDPELVDEVIAKLVESGADYASNTQPATYPDGLDVEVFSRSVLRTAWQNATVPGDREHVTPFIKNCGDFECVSVTHVVDQATLRWTVDEPEDLLLVRRIFEHFSPRRDFAWLEVLAFAESEPEIFAMNRHLVRDEGQWLGTGEKLWRRAKRVIPGGSMLLSKRSEMFLPGNWPSYFSRAKGCRVWDLDGKEFIDMSLMGVGTNTLGYGHPEVDEAVQGTVAAGNMSTLNCPEEVHLAERLVELHPWSEMVRFARSGGEANAIAVRIARAASGRDKIAICGYHGWHDWYLASNLGDSDNLAGHLLPGLDPKGVPQGLQGTVLPFRYNDLTALETILNEHEVGIIKMEVSRSQIPTDDFLPKIRQLADEAGIVLIFDECTSGFRQTFGGLHKFFDVEPDIAVFGKALGNGYGISAVIGRRSVMEAAQDTFISSTFWTERIGSTAALKTLEVMERVRSWEQITSTGNLIGEKWKALAGAHGLSLEVSGLPALSSFRFPVLNMLPYKTLITQEMLKRGFLGTTALYVCTEHDAATVDSYFSALDEVFALIGACSTETAVENLLEGPVCHSNFQRLT